MFAKSSLQMLTVTLFLEINHWYMRIGFDNRTSTVTINQQFENTSIPLTVLDTLMAKNIIILLNNTTQRLVTLLCTLSQRSSRTGENIARNKLFDVMKFQERST